MKIVTLITDFGSADPYVPAMKGVILSYSVNVHLVDISHDVPAQDVLAGRLILGDAWKFYPPGSIHLGVVDPGVGTARLPLIIEADGHIFVGPDNGLFGFTRTCRQKKFWAIRGDLMSFMSPTFAGRDLFAHVVGKLVASSSVKKLGSPLTDIKDLAIAEPKKEKKGFQGEVIYIDRFGNLITNILKSDTLVNPAVEVGRRTIRSMVHTYGAAKDGTLLALWNSSNRLEIAVRNGSAARRLRARRGLKVLIREAKS
ncbi:MAG TPA: SAM-dependent chlorinase/fluorinase [Bdellovibrionota bacterium]|nr:SAM-dependent chlorinase/fluorinase [Bdellovibrionota bacterium]